MTHEVVRIEKELEDLIPDFLSNRKKDVEEIQKAITDQNYKRLAEIGHSLKGLGTSYGFDPISKWGRELEDFSKNQDPSSAQLAADQMKDYLTGIQIVFV